ncbi:DNA helicase [Vibrio inusitatus NBRC 102082]|uniref:DNA helicase n=1 Tax=Vibrio inusitatus NBRC 102082 TaxID=1219070 RepID=A0A4Y3HWP1_9VIBR|nr:helicase-related protein [Vibrio inusitatus]GEA51438.1 DNA helicase [Vibrio inusitatus NBRC 102082]
MTFAKERRGFVNFIEDNLIRTRDKGVKQNPLELFHIGLLRPLPKDKCLTSSKARNSVGSITAPSSAGFSFYVTGESIQLSLEYGVTCFIESDEDPKYKWQKVLEQGNCDAYKADGDGFSQKVVEILPIDSPQKYRGKLYITWRAYKDGYIVTVTLANQQSVTDTNKADKRMAEGTLFDASISCSVLEGEVQSYPQKDFSLLNEEEKELELRYKNVKTYAIGHAVGVDWSIKGGYRVIESNFMPKVEVPSVTANTAGSQTKHLNFKYLSCCHNNPDVLDDLSSFADSYRTWIEGQTLLMNSMESHERGVAKNIVSRAENAHFRIIEGIEFLRENKQAQRAFSYMNEAMLKQMTATEESPDLSRFNWRPFQLAFVLMAMKSSIDEGDINRDLVDLIWFPTGGGKTEAYLGIMAMVFVYRRLVYSQSQDSTVAIMRYTLTLLTGQQFTRAAKVVCALELLRRKSEKHLGDTPFTLGLWVGSKSTPNTFHQAQQEVTNHNFEKLGMTSCPWCKSKFTVQNYVIQERRFDFKCTNDACEFGSSSNPLLPCKTIDESLYDSPPTLLLATVDKFAMLAWDERADVFFGGNGKRPPELIIQDELHLISGALGSMVGLYEVGIEAALIKRGIYPKYIASTATIRNADEQVKSLYGKSSAVFPPAGLEHDDSYFAKTVPISEKPGRLYVGYLAFSKSKRESLEPLSSHIAVAPEIHFSGKPEYKDAWWTQLVYHGSLKGVSASDASYKGPIARSIQQKLFNYSQELGEEEHKPRNKELSRLLNVKSLTSLQGAEKNNQTFTDLEASNDSQSVIDVALATNMISVGLDVERLAVMIINGQPLTTSEYIQASSRVGRGDIPGVVFVNYYKSQTSSLSHYENFRSYHESFYRYVEPTSLTPFTYQALKKALHASLIIAFRMSGIGLVTNGSADLFDSSKQDVSQMVQIFKDRIRNAIEGPFDSELQKQDQSHKLNATLDMLDELIDEWSNYAQESRSKRRQLHFNSKDRAADSLIKTHDANKQALWDTQTSMRNVEDSALINTIRGLKK